MNKFYKTSFPLIIYWVDFEFNSANIAVLEGLSINLNALTDLEMLKEREINETEADTVAGIAKFLHPNELTHLQKLAWYHAYYSISKNIMNPIHITLNLLLERLHKGEKIESTIKLLKLSKSLNLIQKYSILKKINHFKTCVTRSQIKGASLN